MPGEWASFIKIEGTGGQSRSRFSRRGGRGRGGNIHTTFRYATFKMVQDVSMTLSAESGKKKKRKELKAGTVEDTDVEQGAPQTRAAQRALRSAGVSAILTCLCR